jgi:hypothetical protein
LGDLDLDPSVAEDAFPVDEPIEKAIPHPEYIDDPIANDIALVQLKNTVIFTRKRGHTNVFRTVVID